MALSQEDGTVKWSIDCMGIVDGPETACADVIEAESSVSPNGLVFYYGDATGNVKALQLGNSRETTAVPTEFPTGKPTEPPTEPPTLGPSPGPSVSMTPTGVNDTFVPTEVPTFSSDSPSMFPTSAPVTPNPTDAPATPSEPTPATPPTDEESEPTSAPTEGSSSTRAAMASFVVVLTSLLFFVF
jgi:hypothetical protein